MLTREHLAAALTQIGEQRELFGGERDGSPVHVNFMARFVDHYASDFVPLLGCKFTPAPLEGADSAVELFRHIGVQAKIVEATRRVDAGDLPDGHGDQGSYIVEIRLLPHGAQRRNGQIGAVQRLEYQGPWTDFELVVIVTDELDGIVPQVESTHRRTELPQC